MKKKSFIKRLLAYIYMPVIFCIVAYLILWVILQPAWEMGSNYAAFLVSDEMPEFYPQLTRTYETAEASGSGESISKVSSGKAYLDGVYYDTYEWQADGSLLLKERGLPCTQADIDAYAERLKNSVSQLLPYRTAEDGTTVLDLANYVSGEPVTSPAYAASWAAGVRGVTSALEQGTPGEVINGDPYMMIEEAGFPNAGDYYAHLDCERIGLDSPVYWYDTPDILNAGAGQSIASKPPGFGRLVLLSAHDTTFFRCLEYVQVGDVIKLNTNYFDYEYTVTNVEILNEDVLSKRLAGQMLAEEEQLVLYTCWPFTLISTRKTDRFVVTAKPTKALNVKWRDLE